MALTKYLDLAREITGSDYKTAKRLNLTRAAISKARKTGIMSDENIIELAKILDADPLPIIATCNLQRHPENKKFWSKWIAAGASISVILALAAVLYPVDYYGTSEILSFTPLYIMRISLTVAIAGLAVIAWRFGAAIIRARSYTTMD